MFCFESKTFFDRNIGIVIFQKNAPTSVAIKKFLSSRYSSC